MAELNSKYDKPCHIHRTAVGRLGSPFHHTVRRQMNTTEKFWLTHSEYNGRGRSKELGAAEKTISKNYCDIGLCS